MEWCASLQNCKIANLFAISSVGHLRARAHQGALFIALETNNSLALGTRFHIFLLVPSEKRLACFIGHSSRLTVPGAVAVRADSMRSEHTRKLVEIQGAKGGS